MRQTVCAVALVAILGVFAAPASAQLQDIGDTGIDLGIGAIFPINEVMLDGVITPGGNFRATAFVPNSPQFAIEFHRAFQVTPRFGIGPMFYSALSFASTSISTGGPQPISAGIGAVVTLASGGTRTFNVGFAYGRANVSSIVDGRLYRDGYPPADGALDVVRTSRSFGRFVMLISVSGLFGN